MIARGFCLQISNAVTTQPHCAIVAIFTLVVRQLPLCFMFCGTCTFYLTVHRNVLCLCKKIQQLH